MPNQFKKITVKGNNAEIGFQVGQQLKEDLHKNCRFYNSLIRSKLSQQQISESLKHYKEEIQNFFPEILTEIECMAKGAEIDPEQLFIINARTELLVSGDQNECTALVFPNSGLLGQTWDWSNRLEETSSIIEMIKDDGIRILQFTEAGICGKIGMNSSGIGVTLNILRALGLKLKGVPIHILLRRILDCKSLDEVREIGIDQKTASNLIVSNGKQAIDLEYGGDQCSLYEIKEDIYCHTNHYIHLKNFSVKPESHENSICRLRTMNSKIKKSQEFTVDNMEYLLSDTSDNQYPIMRHYIPHIEPLMDLSGTVATIIMDLRKGEFRIRKGNESSPHFNVDDYAQYQITLSN